MAMSTGFVFRVLSFVVLLLVLGWTTSANAATPTTIAMHAMQNLEDADCDGIPDFLDPEITPGGCDEPVSEPPAAEEPDPDEQPAEEPGEEVPPADPNNETPVVEESPVVNPQPAQQVTTLPNTGTGAAQTTSLVPAALMMLSIAALMIRSASRMP